MRIFYDRKTGNITGASQHRKVLGDSEHLDVDEYIMGRPALQDLRRNFAEYEVDKNAKKLKKRQAP